MATLIFSGTTIALSPPGWVELSAGPASRYSWVIDELLLFNTSANPSAVRVARVIGTYSVELYNDVIPAGGAAVVDSINLASGQTLKIHTDEDLDYQAYGTVVSPYRNPANDITYNCLTGDYDGVVLFDIEITGETLNRTYLVPSLSLGMAISISGKGVAGKVHNSSALTIGLGIEITGDAYTRGKTSSWVTWSKIGELVFQADFMNDAGSMPMTWDGPIYNILKLDKHAVVYGRGGVSILYPVTEPMPTFGYRDVLNIGLKSKLAVSGDESIHFFVDLRGRLWQMTKEKIEKLGYEEFLEPLDNLALFYNSQDKRLYISSSEEGFILTKKGLGGGYKNLTGFVNDFESLVLASPDNISVDPLYFVTNTIDFGFRGLKTVESIQVGAETDMSLLVAIDYKMKKTDRNFSTIGWIATNEEGVAYIRVTALEFRIRVRHPRIGYARVDYLNVQYKRTDSRYMRARIGDTKNDRTVAAD